MEMDTVSLVTVGMGYHGVMYRPAAARTMTACGGSSPALTWTCMECRRRGTWRILSASGRRTR